MEQYKKQSQEQADARTQNSVIWECYRSGYDQKKKRFVGAYSNSLLDGESQDGAQDFLNGDPSRLPVIGALDDNKSETHAGPRQVTSADRLNLPIARQTKPFSQAPSASRDRERGQLSPE